MTRRKSAEDLPLPHEAEPEGADVLTARPKSRPRDGTRRDRLTEDADQLGRRVLEDATEVGPRKLP